MSKEIKKTEKPELAEQELDQAAGGKVGDPIRGGDIGLGQNPGGNIMGKAIPPKPKTPSSNAG